MKRALLFVAALALTGIAFAIPGGPPAGNPILNGPGYQKSSQINIDTATIRSVTLSTFTNAPSLPYGIRINGSIYNGTGNDLPGGSINVKDYGAVGDGNTDDWSAIQNAINFVGNAGGGVVFFPHGNFAITNTLVVPSYVTIEGSGMGATTISALSGFFPQDANLIALENLNGTGYTSGAMGEQITIRDIKLDCTGMPTPSGNGTGRGIANGNVNNFTASRVHVKASQGYGISVEGSTGAYTVKNPRIVFCTLENCGRFGGQDSMGGGFNIGAVYAFNVCDAPNGTCIDNVYVKNALWEGNRSINTSTTTHSGSIWSDFGMVDSRVVNNVIENGSIHIYGYLTSQYRSPPYNVTISGNYIKNAGSSGIFVTPANQINTDAFISTGIVITSNRLDGCTDNCISICDQYGTIIANNILDNWNKDNLSDNAIFMFGGPNLTLGVHNAVISGNSGQKGSNNVWLDEAVNFAGAATTNQNVIVGNNFPGGIISLSTTPPTSIYFDIIGGTTAINTNYFHIFNTNDKTDGPNYTDYLAISNIGQIGVHDALPETAFAVRGSTTNGVCPLLGGGPATYVAAFYAPVTTMVDQAGIQLGYDPNGGYGGVIAARSNTTGQPMSFWTSDGVIWQPRVILTKGGILQTKYGFAQTSKTLSQIAAITPATVGESYYCSNCTSETVCVSTATTTGAFVGNSARTNPCQ